MKHICVKWFSHISFITRLYWLFWEVEYTNEGQYHIGQDTSRPLSSVGNSPEKHIVVAMDLQWSRIGHWLPTSPILSGTSNLEPTRGSKMCLLITEDTWFQLTWFQLLKHTVLDQTVPETVFCLFVLSCNSFPFFCLHLHLCQTWVVVTDQLAKANWMTAPACSHLIFISTIFIIISMLLLFGCLSCPTLCDPMDCSPRGSSVPGILQARILEWVAMSFSRGSFPTRRLNLHLLHWQVDHFPTVSAGKPNL